MRIKVPLFHWALVLIPITLPFPSYIINSISIIICCLSWGLYSSINEKYLNLKENFPSFLLLSSLFWVALIGLAYTEDMGEGLRNLEQALPFLVIPLIFFSVKINREIINIILKYFSYSVVLASVFALLKAFYFKVNNLGDYFFFDQLAILLDKHTTYFALFTLVAISFFLYDLSRKNRLLNIINILFLVAMVYMLSVRISVIGLFFIFLIYFLGQASKLSKKGLGLIVFSMVVVLFAYLTPNFQKRFNTNTPEGIRISDIGSRKTHWLAVLDRIGQDSPFFGSGTGDGHIGLYETYRKYNFETGYLYEYNAHNQYLEIYLFYGAIGLVLLLAILIGVLKINLIQKDYFGISVIVLYMIFMFTESILERQSGIVLFSYMMTLLGLPMPRTSTKIDVLAPNNLKN